MVSPSPSASALLPVTTTVAPPTLSVPSISFAYPHVPRPTFSVTPISPKFRPEDLSPDAKPEDVARLTERHTLERVPPTEKKKYPSKRCKVCLRRSGYTPGPARKHPKETVYYCPQCPSKPGLCCFPCYYVYHSKFNFWEPDDTDGGPGSSNSGTGGGGYSHGAPGFTGGGGGGGGGSGDMDYVGRYGGQGGGGGLLITSVSSLADQGAGGDGAMYTGGVADGNGEQKFCPVPVYGESLYGPGGQ